MRDPNYSPAPLLRLVMPNVAPVDDVILRPSEDGVGGELYAVFRDDHARPAARAIRAVNSRTMRRLVIKV